MHFWSNIFNMKILNLWKYFDSNVPLSTFILTSPKPPYISMQIRNNTRITQARTL